MENSKKTIMWVLVILTIMSLGSVNAKAAPSPVSTPVAPAPGPDCMTALLNMTDCLSFVSQGSNDTKPDKNCCPELAGMLDSNPICLCQMIVKSKDFGISLDTKRAFKLPSLCKLQTPDVSLCSVIGIPVAAPGALAKSPARAPTSGALAGAPTSGASSSLSPTAGLTPAAGEAATGGRNGASSSAQFNVVAYLVAAGLAMAFTHYN